MALFTTETASEMGQRSGAARRNAPFIFVPNPPTVVKPNGTDKPPKDHVQTIIKRQCDLVAEQIRHTRDVLNDERFDYCEHCERAGVAPNHRAALLKSLDALLSTQRKLLNVPDPGTRRPGREPSRRSSVIAEPEPASGTPPVVSNDPPAA